MAPILFPHKFKEHDQCLSLITDILEHHKDRLDAYEVLNHLLVALGERVNKDLTAIEQRLNRVEESMTGNDKKTSSLGRP